MGWSDYVVESDPRTFLWEILVPTVRRVKVPVTIKNCNMTDGERNGYRTRFHRVWDEKVRVITGGLTIMQPVNGQWINEGELHAERMIPVRIVATRDQINAIVDMTLEYYDQLAVLCYKLSDEVILKNRKV